MPLNLSRAFAISEPSQQVRFAPAVRSSYLAAPFRLSHCARRLALVRSAALARAGAKRHASDVTKPAIDLSNLSPDEKFELIDELWQSLAPEDFALTSELRAELDRRLDRLDHEGPSGTPWDQVRSKMTTQR
jgi:putative addiction module component (TIGR02574 family)